MILRSSGDCFYCLVRKTTSTQNQQSISYRENDVNALICKSVGKTCVRGMDNWSANQRDFPYKEQVMIILYGTWSYFGTFSLSQTTDTIVTMNWGRAIGLQAGHCDRYRCINLFTTVIHRLIWVFIHLNIGL